MFLRTVLVICLFSAILQSEFSEGFRLQNAKSHRSGLHRYLRHSKHSTRQKSFDEGGRLLTTYGLEAAETGLGAPPGPVESFEMDSIEEDKSTEAVGLGAPPGPVESFEMDSIEEDESDSAEEVGGGSGRPGSDGEFLEAEEIQRPQHYVKIVGTELLDNKVVEVQEHADDEMEQRAGTGDTSLRWKNYEMLLKIDPKFSDEKMEQIRAAIWTLKDTLKCFSFKVVPPQSKISKKRDSLYIRHGNNEGCSSALGRTKGRQETIISESCAKFYGTIMHEIMHVLGFFHEQVRTDRDNYVKINNKVLTNANLRHQYKIRDNQKQFVNKYDFDSVMHYPFNAAMKPKRNKVPNGVIVGQRNHLSDSDKSRLRRMYPCSKAPRH